jgi:predicted nucleotidyltransferase
MAIADVMRALRTMKEEGSLSEFMLYGSVAAMVHTRPFFTNDVDIAIVVDSDVEFISVFNRLSDFGKVSGHAIEIDGTQAEIFPVDISPVIQDAVETAMSRKVEGFYVKVAGPEHLVLEALRVGRPQDQARVLMLDNAIDHDVMRSALLRLDEDGTLERNYREITGKAP